MAERGGARSAILVVGAAGVAGVVGFVVTFLVARSIGPAASAGFAAVWSGTYLAVGSLAGIQQEVARATRPIGAEREDATALRRFALLSAAAVLLIAGAVAVAWTLAVFGSGNEWLVIPLALGPAAYVIVAIISGALYGLARWVEIAALIVIDAVLRLIAVGTTLLVTHDLTALAWAVAIPFGLAPLIVWPAIRGRLVGRIAIDVPLPVLVSNSLRTVLGTLATSALVSGLPLFIVAASPDRAARVVGAFAFVVTVARAPVMVGVMSLQSLLVVRLRDAPRPGVAAAAIIAVVVGTGLVLAGIAALIGDPILTLLVGPGFQVGSLALFVIVASSGLMGALFVTGPLAIAQRRQGVFAVGWLIAAAVGIAFLYAPWSFEVRLAASLVLAPIVGVLTHAIGLAVPSRR